MSYDFEDNRKRAFKPNSKIPGGSKPGVEKKHWPYALKVIMDALTTKARGGAEGTWEHDRSNPHDWFTWKRLLDQYAPGWHDWAKSHKAKRKRLVYLKDLWNRVYKMYYDGTSSRGPNHDPWTRPYMSKEHWRKRLGPRKKHPLYRMYMGIVTGNITEVPDWENDYRYKPPRWKGVKHANKKR